MIIVVVIRNDALLVTFPNVDIMINTSRTKGATRRHLEHSYNYATGWLFKYIYVQKFHPSNSAQEADRDLRIMNELKSWLTGLEKL